MPTALVDPPVCSVQTVICMHGMREATDPVFPHASSVKQIHSTHLTPYCCCISAWLTARPAPCTWPHSFMTRALARASSRPLCVNQARVVGRTSTKRVRRRHGPPGWPGHVAAPRPLEAGGCICPPALSHTAAHGCNNICCWRAGTRFTRKREEGGGGAHKGLAGPGHSCPCMPAWRAALQCAAAGRGTQRSTPLRCRQ